MSIRAVLSYIDTRAKQDEDEEMYRSITAEYIAMIGTGRRSEKYISYARERAKIYGTHEEDTRTAQEIVKDTLEARNLKLAEE